MKILLFDIDGTLLLTGGVGKIAFEKTFEEVFGISEAWGDLRPDGKTDPILIDEIVTRCLKRSSMREEYDRIGELYLKYFRQDIEKADRFRLLPGVSKLLDELSLPDKYLLGIATGNFEEAAWLKLERGSIKKYFQFGGFGSDFSERLKLTAVALERGKKILGRAISNSDIYVIGDTPYDIAVGKKLGVQTIAVGTGSHTKADLAECNPDYYLDELTNPSEFLGIIS